MTHFFKTENPNSFSQGYKTVPSMTSHSIKSKGIVKIRGKLTKKGDDLQNQNVTLKKSEQTLIKQL